jgi:methionyl-tRNA formyltransferase
VTTPLRIIFAGTPDFAADHLAALLASNHQVVAVYTQPDRPAGRGQQLQASPVKQLALQHQIPVYQPKSLKKSAAQTELKALQADVMVVVAYGLLLPVAVLETPRLGCINVHGSLLPRWRGAAPIQRALWAGDSETGITIMQMDQGLDTGAMLSKHVLAITETDTSATLYQKLAKLGPEALLNALADLPALQQQAQAQQSDEATYAEKLTKDEGKFDFSKSAHALALEVRAFTPWPGSFIGLPQGNIKVGAAHALPPTAPSTASSAAIGTVLQADKNGIHIQTADGILVLTQLQPPGKKMMPVADFLNGRADWFSRGIVLTQQASI